MSKFLMFDLDGTLVDTAPGIRLAVNELLRQRQHPELSEAVVKSAIGGGIEELVKHLSKDLIKTEEDFLRLASDFKTVYRGLVLDHSQIYSGVMEFLRSWSGPVAIVSNKSSEFIKPLVENTQLSEINWTCIYGGDTFSVKKPDPYPLAAAMKCASVVREDAIMIGDGLPDVGAANAAGVKCIAVDFGYTPVCDLLSAGAHAQISHYHQLNSLIANLGSVV